MLIECVDHLQFGVKWRLRTWEVSWLDSGLNACEQEEPSVAFGADRMCGSFASLVCGSYVNIVPP